MNLSEEKEKLSFAVSSDSEAEQVTSAFWPIALPAVMTYKETVRKLQEIERAKAENQLLLDGVEAGL